MSSDARHMNDTTMPPPRKTTSTPTTATPTTATRVAPRHKTALKKGFGLSDWNQLLRKSQDLARRQGKPLQRYRWDEIKQHRDVHDGWVVLRGKVYNVSPYLPYHPGGEAILRKVLGKDITALYDKYHPWVNEEGLIGKLLIGYLDTSGTPQVEQKTSYLPTTSQGAAAGMSKDGFAMPAPRVPKAVAKAQTTTLGKSTSTDDEEEEPNLLF